MKAEWSRKSAALWTYRIGDAAQLYGYVVQYEDAARSPADWDAIVVAARGDDDMTIAERVSFDEAKNRLQQHAYQYGDWMFGER